MNSALLMASSSEQTKQNTYSGLLLSFLPTLIDPFFPSFPKEDTSTLFLGFSRHGTPPLMPLKSSILNKFHFLH